MRFAFNPYTTPNSHSLVINLYDAATASEPKVEKICSLAWERENLKAAWRFSGTIFDRPLDKSDVLIAIKLSKLTAAIDGDITPLKMARALLAGRAVQIAWDPILKKNRCVGTMKEGKDEYVLVGTKLTVQAEDDDTASRLAKREAADAMADGKDIDAIASWFKGGCKLQKEKSGKLPDFLKVESLACTPAEIELAKQPIKSGAAKED